LETVFERSVLQLVAFRLGIYCSCDVFVVSKVFYITTRFAF